MKNKISGVIYSIILLVAAIAGSVRLYFISTDFAQLITWIGGWLIIAMATIWIWGIIWPKKETS